MNESCQSIARKLFDIIEKYIVAYRKYQPLKGDFVWIRDNATGEIIIFAKSLETAKKHIQFIKENENGQ